MRVALHVGQLLQPVPGGIGRLPRTLLRGLPRYGVDVTPFAAGAAVSALPTDYVNLAGRTARCARDVAPLATTGRACRR